MVFTILQKPRASSCYTMSVRLLKTPFVFRHFSRLWSNLLRLHRFHQDFFIFYFYKFITYMWAVEAYGMPSAKAGMGSRAAQLIGLPRRSNYRTLSDPTYEMSSSGKKKKKTVQDTRYSRCKREEQQINVCLGDGVHVILLWGVERGTRRNWWPHLLDRWGQSWSMLGSRVLPRTVGSLSIVVVPVCGAGI